MRRGGWVDGEGCGRCGDDVPGTFLPPGPVHRPRHVGGQASAGCSASLHQFTRACRGRWTGCISQGSRVGAGNVPGTHGGGGGLTRWVARLVTWPGEFLGGSPEWGAKPARLPASPEVRATWPGRQDCQSRIRVQSIVPGTWGASERGSACLRQDVRACRGRWTGIPRSPGAETSPARTEGVVD